MPSISQNTRFAQSAGPNNPLGIYDDFKPSRLITGSGAPAATHGENFWQYLDSSSGILYSKKEGVWVAVVDYPSIVGVGTTMYAAQSTGLVSGGLLSAGTTANTYKISAGSSVLVVGNAVSLVSWIEFDDQVPAFGDSLTYVSIGSAGNVIQSNSPPSNTAQRSQTLLGVVVHVDGANINGYDQEQQTVLNPASQFGDLVKAIGQFRIIGLVLMPVAGTLSTGVSYGKSFVRGGNFATNPDDPHVIEYLVRAAVDIQYRLSDGTNYTALTNNVFLPDVYESPLGTVAAVPAGNFTIQYVYQFPNGDIKAQMGQNLYATMDNAIAEIGKESITYEASMLANGIIIANVILQQGATNLDSAITSRIFASGGLGQDTSGGAAASFDQSLNTTDSVAFMNVSSDITTDTITSPAATMNINAGAGSVNLLSTLNLNNNIIENVGLINGVDITALPETASEIKILYESNADTNAYTDAEKTKVGYITTSAGDPMVFVSASLDVAGSYTRTHISGSYAFVCISTQGLLVYEISNKLEPVYYAGASGTPTYLIADLDITGAYTDCEVVGNYAYVTSTGTNSGLRVYDISGIGSGVITLINTPNPIISGGYTSVTSDGGNYLYVTAGAAGIHRVSISNPILPVITATHDTGGGYDEAAVSAGTIVYSHNGAGLEIIDATSNATFAGAALSTTSLAGTFAGGVSLNGTTLYLSRGNANGLVAYNVSNPAAPSFLYSNAAGSVSCFLAAGYLFSCNGSSNLLTAFLPDLTAPFSIASADPEHVTGAGTYLYVSNGTAGLDIYTTEGLILFDGVELSALQTTADGALQRSGGTMTGDIIMGANNITLTTGLVDGVDVSARDAVLTTTTTTANNALPKAGGTMTGNITMGSNNIITNGLIDSVDVSARDAVLTTTTTTANNALQRSGGTMTGSIIINAGAYAVGHAGTQALPTYTFTGATSYGMWLKGANTLAFSAAATEIMSLTSSTVALRKIVQCTEQVQAPVGDLAAPSYAFTNDTNTGMRSVGTDGLALVAGGSDRLTIDNFGTSILNGLSATGIITTTYADSETDPSIYLMSSPNNAKIGFYRDANDSLGVSSNGALVWSFRNSEHITLKTIRPNAVNTLACGTATRYWTTSYATTWTDVSDVRVKTNISPFSAGLDLINSFAPQTFDFTVGTPATPSKILGLIAQDVANVMYNAGFDILSQNVIDNPYVETNDPTESVAYTGVKRADDDVYSINYSAVGCLLINAIKELTARVVALENAPSSQKLSTISEAMTSSGESTTAHVGDYKDTTQETITKMKREMKAMKAQIAGLRAEMDSMAAAEMMRSQREEFEAFDLVEAP